MSGRSLTIVVVLAAVLASCGSSSESGGSVPAASDTAGATTSSTLIPPPASTTTEIPPTTSSTTTTSTSTTTTSTTTSTTTTTSTVAPGPDLSGLVLEGDGIGPVQFGADADGAIDYLNSFLGAPTHDTDWIDPFEIGLCPGTELRLVSWGALTITLGDESDSASGRRHFVSYSYGVEGQIGLEPVGLATAQGITVGSSVGDLVGAYPDTLLIPEDDFAGPTFVIDEAWFGYLTGIDDDDLVTVILGGESCGE